MGFLSVEANTIHIPQERGIETIEEKLKWNA